MARLIRFSNYGPSHLLPRVHSDMCQIAIGHICHCMHVAPFQEYDLRISVQMICLRDTVTMQCNHHNE